jgi:hypothetical protein
MATNSISLKLDQGLLSILSEGTKRTPLKRPELIRRTLRRHLREVIEAEARSVPPRLTTVSPWPKWALAKAYRRAGVDWDKIEAAAVAAQRVPDERGGRV